MINTSFSLLSFGTFRGVRSAYSGSGGGNASSMGYVNPDVAAVIAGISVLLLAFIVYKVWRGLKNDRKVKRSKKEEEAEAFRQLYEDNFGEKDDGMV